ITPKSMILRPAQCFFPGDLSVRPPDAFRSVSGVDFGLDCVSVAIDRIQGSCLAICYLRNCRKAGVYTARQEHIPALFPHKANCSLDYHFASRSGRSVKPALPQNTKQQTDSRFRQATDSSPLNFSRKARRLSYSRIAVLRGALPYQLFAICYPRHHSFITEPLTL